MSVKMDYVNPCMRSEGWYNDKAVGWIIEDWTPFRSKIFFSTP